MLDLAEEGFTTPAATGMSAIEAFGIAAVSGALTTERLFRPRR